MTSRVKEKIKFFDGRRNIAIPGTNQETIAFCIEHFIETANAAIDDHGYFAVALSGGSTPKAIFEGLSKEANRHRVDWSRLILFWSDERCVSPDDQESNFKMAMDSGFSSLPIPIENIFRMKAEKDPESYAKEYEKLVNDKLNGASLDMVMLGMGADGHTASLFPKTHALHSGQRLVVANYIPEKDTWRMTLTFECINKANSIVVYVLGSQKAETVAKVLLGDSDPDCYPIQNIGTTTHKALWVLDEQAAEQLAS